MCITSSNHYVHFQMHPNIFKRLQLFQLCGQFSLISGFLPQTDTFFKAAISVVPDIPEFLIDPITKQRTPTEEMVSTNV